MRAATPLGTPDSTAAVLAKALTFGLRSKELCLDEGECTKAGIPHRWTIEANPKKYAAPPRQSGDFWLAWCPAHMDTSPMLGVWDTDGRVAVKCYDRCELNEILGALKERGLGTDRIGGPEPVPSEEVKRRTERLFARLRVPPTSPQASRQADAAEDAQPAAAGSAAGVAAEAVAGWPKPESLTNRTTGEPYPVDALPETVRAAIIEVQAFTQAPIAMVSGCALAAISLAGAALVDVERAQGLTGPTSLFMLTIADSGERKSTCDAYFTKAIREFEAEEARRCEPAQKAHQAKARAWEAKQEGVLQGIKTAAKTGRDASSLEARLTALEEAKPKAPRVPTLILGDETPENLAWRLARSWPNAGVLSAEAGIVLGAHGMGNDSVMRNLTLLNLLWDGGVHSVGRRTSESFTVRGARLTVGLQIQEAALRAFVDKAGELARGTGFLARFLLSRPESTQGYRPFKEAPQAWPARSAFDHRLTAMLRSPVPIDDDGVLSPQLLSFSKEAKAAWVADYDEIETELRAGGALHDVRDVASKAMDNAARLAALFQVFEHGPGPVGLTAFTSASRIVQWHLNEARRFFGELALPPEFANASRLEEWLVDYCHRTGVASVPLRTVQQFGPNRLRKMDALLAAAGVLQDCKRARLTGPEVSYDNQRRPRIQSQGRREIILNPMLLRR